MLDDFKEEQPIVYKTLFNSVKNNRISHAYLFELNDYSNGVALAISFVKFLLCPNNYSNNSKCENCFQCNNIDNNNFLEFKIIKPDGQWIKKEQLDELQKAFVKKSLIGNKKVYIIMEAEKLNASSSNSLLKFLEEPPEGIIAILITNNLYQILNTIISRCQILSLKKDCNVKDINTYESLKRYFSFENLKENIFLKNEEIEFIIDFIQFLEKNNTQTIIYKNKSFIECFNDRKKIIIAFEVMILYYKDVLNAKLGLDLDIFYDYIDSMSFVLEKNSIDNLVDKIKILVELHSSIKYNLNSNILLDKLVILFNEV